jgi:Protein of unknown function (DUF1570)
MSRPPIEDWIDPVQLDRRAWLRRSLVGAAALECFGVGPRDSFASQDPKPRHPPAEDAADKELRQAEVRAREVTSRPIRIVKSAHFQAVGDATESFMNLTLADCELIALDYLDHYRAKGFEVKLPDDRLTLVVFFDERPYMKMTPGVSIDIPGIYKRPENWLALFDFRNVPMRQYPAAKSNISTLAHECTHQLTFNTGLLNRQGDVPRAIVEGFGTCAETRPLRGRSQPGKINVMRLDALAHVQRRTKWVEVKELLTDERAAFGTSGDQAILSYAESWLLVYHLMTSPTRLPQFQAYLKAIQPRKDQNRRFDDAETHFGNLDRLDQELRRESIQLLRSL